MAFGMEFSNGAGQVVTRGVEDTYCLWGHTVVTIPAFSSNVRIPLFNIPASIPCLMFRGYNTFPANEAAARFEVYVNIDNGVYELYPESSVSQIDPEMEVFAFVRARDIPDREAYGLRIFDGTTKMFTTDMPFLKGTGFMRQLGANASIISGSAPASAAGNFTRGWTGEQLGGGVFHGGTLKREWSTGPSGIPFPQNEDTQSIIIDRDYYRQFPSLGNWP